jgi:hypothetical protein
MFSKTLVKLIDEAIIPALVLVAAKVLGVLFVGRVKNLIFEVSFKSHFLPLPTLVFSSYQDYVTVNSYSNLIMLGVVSLGLVWILLKANLLHDTHISPKLAAQLARLSLSRLISTTFEAYHQALVWYGFAWFTTILMAFYAYLGLAYKSFALIAFLIVLNLTWFFIFDVEREIIIWQRDKEGV